MTKQVKLSKNVHERLLHLKKKTDAKSINDVILHLLETAEEFYTQDGNLKIGNKKTTFKYNKGKLVEIHIE